MFATRKVSHIFFRTAFHVSSSISILQRQEGNHKSMKIHIAIVSQVLLLVISRLGVMVTASPITCATIDGHSIRVGSYGNYMDEKVQGCPRGYRWESCCAVCGNNLQNDVKLDPGWYCEKNRFGIWLKGCRTANACPSDHRLDDEDVSSA